MMEVDCIFVGGGWEGEVKRVEYVQEPFLYLTRPIIGSVGPEGIREKDYQPGLMFYLISKYVAEDGKTYLVAKTDDAHEIDLEAVIRDSFPKPKPFEQ